MVTTYITCNVKSSQWHTRTFSNNNNSPLLIDTFGVQQVRTAAAKAQHYTGNVVQPTLSHAAQCIVTAMMPSSRHKPQCVVYADSTADAAAQQLTHSVF